MTRFCGNCGAQLDEDARVCGQCGTPIDGNKGNIPGLKVIDPAKKKNLMKKIKTVVALLIVAMLVVVGTKVTLSFIGTNGLVRKVMAAYEDYDIGALVALSSDMYYYSDYENYVDEYFEDSVGSNIDKFESSVGHSYKMSYEIEKLTGLKNICAKGEQK